MCHLCRYLSKKLILAITAQAINVDVDEVEVDEHLLAPKEDFFDRVS